MEAFSNYFDVFVHDLGINEIENHKDIYIIHCDKIRNMSIKVGNPDAYTTDSYTLKMLREGVEQIAKDYKKILLFSPEEFGYEYKSVEYFVDLCMEYGIKLYIYSFNCTINDFLKIKYPNDYPHNIRANSPETLLQLASSQVNDWNGEKSKKLLFLNYNRKINRDLIITYLKNWGELFNQDNIISYHNNYTFDSKMYKVMYKDFADKNGIDFDYLDSLVLKPEEVDIHQQNEAQFKAQWLHCHSKFNIICEPFFGLSDDPTEYEYYNHTLSRKIIYPILYKNVIFVHEHSPMLSKVLNQLGFYLFFDNIEDFKNNMTDEFYYSEETQQKLNINKNLLNKYTANGNSKLSLSRKILAEELLTFFI